MNITRAHFQKIVDATFSNIQALSKGKGEEYAGTQEVQSNELANFDRLATKLGISPEKVLWVYVTKHLDAIENYINNLDSPAQKILSEPIEGRIDDALLYLLLAKAMVVRRVKPSGAITGGLLPAGAGWNTAAENQWAREGKIAPVDYEGANAVARAVR